MSPQEQDRHREETRDPAAEQTSSVPPHRDRGAGAEDRSPSDESRREDDAEEIREQAPTDLPGAAGGGTLGG